MRAVLIPMEGTPRVVEVAERGGSTLAGLQELVGGSIEPVAMPLGQEGYGNEEAKLIEMPRNATATELWLRALRERELRRIPGDYIAGPIVVLGPLTDEGDSQPVEQAFIDLVTPVLVPSVNNCTVEAKAGGRTKTAVWDLGPAPSDFQGRAARRCATLSLFHYADRHCFVASLRNVVRSEDGVVESTMLMDQVTIDRLPCPRYSERQRDTAFVQALVMAVHRFNTGDEPVVRFFRPAVEVAA